eukprot:TRINITY_DN1953_c0_g2_i10.p1 TRINITY_DN1953_c0_g2~~TRINITY_DN1953_c0_g2_i10.p1  ORF type:complete len:272 (+),score=66.30 TRINITY_DN1953_c0_g2_i10:760-1575(+)
MATYFKFCGVRDLFPHVDEEIIFSIFSTNKNNSETTVLALKEIFFANPGKEILPVQKKVQSHQTSPSQRKQSPEIGTQSQVLPQQQQTSSKTLLHPPRQIIVERHLNTVQESEQESMEEIKQRITLAGTGRNNCFRESTRAYLCGNMKDAKELSMMGKHYTRMLQEAQDLLVRNLLKSHECHSCLKGRAPQLDLHGLHVSEALRALESVLDIYSRFRHPPTCCLEIITGAGFHSPGRACIKPAVANFLSTNSYKFIAKEGSFSVFLQRAGK